jgi:hypothetical protein
MDHRLKRIKHATHAGARELAHAGMHNAARAIETHGAGISAIVTDDWVGHFDRALKGGSHGHSTHTPKHSTRKTTRKAGGKKKRGKRKGRSPAQRAATARMLAAAKRKRGKKGKRSAKRRKKR